MKSILDHATIVWLLNIQKDIEVQRCAAKFISNNYSRLTSVNKMLIDFNWATLTHSRKEQKAVMLHKIVHHLVDSRPVIISHQVPHLISPEAIIKDFCSHHPQSMHTYIHFFPL